MLSPACGYYGSNVYTHHHPHTGYMGIRRNTAAPYRSRYTVYDDVFLMAVLYIWMTYWTRAQWNEYAFTQQEYIIADIIIYMYRQQIVIYYDCIPPPCMYSLTLTAYALHWMQQIPVNENCYTLGDDI